MHTHCDCYGILMGAVFLIITPWVVMKCVKLYKHVKENL